MCLFLFICEGKVYVSVCILVQYRKHVLQFATLIA